MAFYEFNQNNSGGSFDYNTFAGITHHVIIEANSVDEAITRAGGIGLYFDGVGDCPCCGDRWSTPWRDEGTAEPMIYGKPAREYDGLKWLDKEVAIHYLNGTVEMF